MRNLVEYPVTEEEIIQCLQQFRREVDPDKTQLCGDMRPILLTQAIYLIQNPEAELDNTTGLYR